MTSNVSTTPIRLPDESATTTPPGQASLIQPFRDVDILISIVSVFSPFRLLMNSESQHRRRGPYVIRNAGGVLNERFFFFFLLI